ncbi:MAG: hypothetical protein GOV02_04245 [Candidatus Aenigmarchaeota archaeon]|nr:hypothetical protein [Candidatus Aenigmarchaeota archaeon]
MSKKYVSFDKKTYFEIRPIDKNHLEISVHMNDEIFRSEPIEYDGTKHKISNSDGKMISYKSIEKLIDEDIDFGPMNSNAYKTLKELNEDKSKKIIKKSFIQEIGENWKKDDIEYEVEEISDTTYRILDLEELEKNIRKDTKIRLSPSKVHLEHYTENRSKRAWNRNSGTVKKVLEISFEEQLELTKALSSGVVSREFINKIDAEGEELKPVSGPSGA